MRLRYGRHTAPGYAALALAVAGTACGDGSGPKTPVATTMAIFSGDAQRGAIGTPIEDLLQVVVRDQNSNPFTGAQVTWTIVASAGDGAALDSTTTTTNVQGLASMTGQYGDVTGDYVISAAIEGSRVTPVQFTLEAIIAPVIESIEPDPIVEGATTATLRGRDFSPDLASNIVTLDGVAGTVLDASETELLVEMPRARCLPARDSAVVRAAVGDDVGPRFRHPAVPGDPPVGLDVGAHEIRSDAAGVECAQFAAASSGSQHLVIAAVTQSSGDFLSGERLRRTRGTSSTFDIGGYDLAAATVTASTERDAETALLETGRAFEAQLREYEREWLSGRIDAARALQTGSAAPGTPALAISPQSVPAEGETFQLNVPKPSSPCTNFVEVTVQVRAVSDFAIIVEDVAAPSGGFDDPDYEAIAAEFDSKIYPTNTLYFGSPSDIDGNGRVLILYTPEVNKLTPAGSTGFIAGFFFAGDLFPPDVCPQSNEAEIFYLLVPDPNGVFGIRHSTESVRQLTRGVVAHELQHLINAAHKIALTDPLRFEDTWLDEALSHLAEEVVGHAVTGKSPGEDLSCADFAGGCGSNDFRAFHIQNFFRASLYLHRDSIARNSPIRATDNLQTRGAAWLLLRWILDQEGPERSGGEVEITRDLVITPLTGITNLETAVGKSFADLVSEWLPALYTDNLSIAGLSPRLAVTSWNLRSVYETLPTGGYPLVPTSITYADGTTDFSLRNGSGRFFLLNSSGASPALSLRFSDLGDGSLNFSSLQPRTLIVRLQ